jgi:hypothetical protein
MTVRYVLHPTIKDFNYKSVTGAISAANSGDEIHVYNGQTQAVLVVKFYKDDSQVVLGFSENENLYNMGFDEILNNTTANFKKAGNNIFYDTGAVLIGSSNFVYITSVENFNEAFNLKVYGGAKISGGSFVVGDFDNSSNFKIFSNGNLEIGRNDNTSVNIDSNTGNITTTGTLIANQIEIDSLTTNLYGHVFCDVTGNLDGNAKTASKLNITTEIRLSGDIDGLTFFDGSQNTLITSSIKNGIITENKIAPFAITGDKIATNTIFGDKIKDGEITAIKIADYNIGDIKLADNGIGTEKIKQYAITNDKIAYQTITYDKILNGTISNNNLAGGITGEKIATGAITTDKIFDGQITTSKIADGQITSAKITDGTIQTSNIAYGAITNEKILLGTIDNDRLAGSITGDKFADQTITSSKIASGQITTEKIASGAIINDKILPRTITNDRLAGSITSDKFVDHTITTNKIGDSQITGEKILANTITNDKILPGTITNDRLEGSITTDKLVDGIITTGKISNLQVTSDKINDFAIVSGKIANGAITRIKITDGSVNTAKIEFGSITKDLMVDNSIGTTQIINQNVTLDKLNSDITDILYAKENTLDVDNKLSFKANLENPIFTGIVVLPHNTIKETMITDSNVTESKIANLSISMSKIKNNAITENKIGVEAVTNDKIKTYTINYDKLVQTSNNNRLLGVGSSTNTIGEVQIQNEMIENSTIQVEKLAQIPGFTILANNDIVTGTITATKLVDNMVNLNTLNLNKIQKILPDVILGRGLSNHDPGTIEEIPCHAPGRIILACNSINEIREQLSINNVDNMSYDSIKDYTDQVANTKADLDGSNFTGIVTIKQDFRVKSTQDDIIKFNIDNLTGNTEISGSINVGPLFEVLQNGNLTANNTEIDGTLYVLNNDTTLKNLTVVESINVPSLFVSTINSNNIESSGYFNLEGNFTITNSFGDEKFKVTNLNGKTDIDGQLEVNGLTMINNDFIIKNTQKIVTNTIESHNYNPINIKGSVINIGEEDSLVNINGSINYIQSNNLEVKDPTITLNKGGHSAIGSGFIFEDTTSNGYLLVDTDKKGLVFRGPSDSSQKRIATLSDSETLINKTIEN